MNRGIVSFDPAFLAKALHFPSGTTIVDARIDHFRGSQVELVVEHPSLPDVDTGAHAPRVSLNLISVWVR